jgi:hypothetical protein
LAHGQVNIFAFSPDRLRSAFQTWDADPVEDATVEYLAGYLRDIGVQAVLHEEIYMDRHYLEEFAEYYSRSFRVVPARAQRLLFFACEADVLEHAYAKTFSPASTDQRDGRETLQTMFRGFSVVRPLKGAAVGRTVVATYPPQQRRRYTAVRPYAVHLASGCELIVNGLAFQQQDVGAAVCASTSLWSALQRVAYVSGHRSPTPVEVTQAAASPFPASHGLDDSQMATALSNLGYDAEFFPVAENRPMFRACVAACLDSRLPVVLTLRKKVKTGAGWVQVGHAVTVAGYRLNAPWADVPGPADGIAPLKIRGAAIDVVYVHDDNLGPPTRTTSSTTRPRPTATSIPGSSGSAAARTKRP